MLARIIIVLIVLSSLLLLGGYAWTESRARQLEAAAQTELTNIAFHARHPRKKVYHSGDLLGAIQVPRLGLSVLVVEGADDESLKAGAGHVKGTAFPGHSGNSGIAAHRDTSFRPLRFIQPGDDILITTPGGASHYVVENTCIVTPQDGWVLRGSRREHALTLVTCYPFFYAGNAPNRFIVRAAKRS